MAKRAKAKKRKTAAEIRATRLRNLKKARAVLRKKRGKPKKRRKG